MLEVSGKRNNLKLPPISDPLKSIDLFIKVSLCPGGVFTAYTTNN